VHEKLGLLVEPNKSYILGDRRGQERVHARAQSISQRVECGQFECRDNVERVLQGLANSAQGPRENTCAASQRQESPIHELHFRVRLFYNQYVSAIQKDNVPDYCAWFEPFVMNWLEDNDEISMEYLHNAYEKDKQGAFQQTSEHCNFNFSSSIYISLMDFNFENI